VRNRRSCQVRFAETPVADWWRAAVSNSGKKPKVCSRLTFPGGRGWRGRVRHRMTTWWRPDLERIRAEIAAEAELEAEVKVEASDGDGAKQGTKRKRAPRTKGPCEHGVKKRSNCKVCSACPHGRRRTQCKECGGSQYASTVVSALDARSAVGHQYVSTVVSAIHARSAVGLQSASTVVSAFMQGVRWGINLRARSSALSVQGVRWVHQSASTVVYALSARSVVGQNMRARSSAL
jgi:hypothetical protein